MIWVAKLLIETQDFVNSRSIFHRLLLSRILFCGATFWLLLQWHWQSWSLFRTHLKSWFNKAHTLLMTFGCCCCCPGLTFLWTGLWPQLPLSSQVLWLQNLSTFVGKVVAAFLVPFNWQEEKLCFLLVSKPWRCSVDRFWSKLFCFLVRWVVNEGNWWVDLRRLMIKPWGGHWCLVDRSV